MLPDLQNIKTNKMFFKLIDFGTIKINTTFRVEKKALNFDLDKGFGALTILTTVLSSFANISDAPLKFKALVITNVFDTQENIQNKIIRHLMRQGILQFYKLIGSSDMLGNPVGFVNKLGSGVFEFFSEPTKGLIKGPKEFVGGIGKGVTSLVTGVVSAGFDSTSKISGSFYSILKSVSGQETKYHRKPKDALEGFYEGTIGGGTEIYEGVTGVVSKPYNGAKKGGTFGFIKGTGTGICGLVVSPLTCTLRTCTTYSQGITSSAIAIKKGKLPSHGRFRYPRYINQRNILEPYDDEYSQANYSIMTIKNGKYSSENIVYFAIFPIFNKFKLTKKEAMMIVTDNFLLFVRDQKKVLFKTKMDGVHKVEVYEGGEVSNDSNASIFHLYVYSNNKRNYVFETLKYSVADKTYWVLLRQMDRYIHESRE